MYELDEELDHTWIRSLLATGADGATGATGIGGGAVAAVSREQVLAAGRARLARRRLSVGVGLAVAVVVAAAGYLVSDAGAGAYRGHSAVTASTAPSVRQGPAAGTAARMDPSPTPSAS